MPDAKVQNCQTVTCNFLQLGQLFLIGPLDSFAKIKFIGLVHEDKHNGRNSCRCLVSKKRLALSDHPSSNNELKVGDCLRVSGSRTVMMIKGSRGNVAQYSVSSPQCLVTIGPHKPRTAQ